MDSRLSGSSDYGQIVLDSPEALMLGYSSARFEGHLRRVGRTIYIWQIRSKDPGKGHLSRLIQRMLDLGYTVKVPTPIGRMAEIVRQKEFTRSEEYDPHLEPFEVWIKELRPPPVAFPETNLEDMRIAADSP